MASEMADDREASKEIIGKERELEEIEKKQSNTLDLLIEFPKDQHIKFKYGEFGKQIEALKTEIEVLKDQERRPVLTNFLNQVEGDPAMKNAVLKDLGYRITIHGALAKSSFSSSTLNFTLIRRSQIYHCYIVRQHETFEDVELELGPIENPDHKERYLAINRDGLLAEAPTDQELINTLKDSRSHNVIL